MWKYKPLLEVKYITNTTAKAHAVTDDETMFDDAI